VFTTACGADDFSCILCRVTGSGFGTAVNSTDIGIGGNDGLVEITLSAGGIGSIGSIGRENFGIDGTNDAPNDRKTARKIPCVNRIRSIGCVIQRCTKTANAVKTKAVNSRINRDVIAFRRLGFSAVGGSERVNTSLYHSHFEFGLFGRSGE
jgi:hypothetical protein